MNKLPYEVDGLHASLYNFYWIFFICYYNWFYDLFLRIHYMIVVYVFKVLYLIHILILDIGLHSFTTQTFDPI